MKPCGAGSPRPRPSARPRATSMSTACSCAPAVPNPKTTSTATTTCSTTTPRPRARARRPPAHRSRPTRSEEHTSELQSPCNLVCRLLLEKKIQPPVGQLIPDGLSFPYIFILLREVFHREGFSE